jgi:hypothetical protein
MRVRDWRADAWGDVAQPPMSKRRVVSRAACTIETHPSPRSRAEEHAFQNAGQRKCSGQTQGHPDNDRPRALADDQRDYARRHRAERHADSDFPCPPRHGVGDDAIDADRRKEQRGDRFSDTTGLLNADQHFGHLRFSTQLSRSNQLLDPATWQQLALEGHSPVLVGTVLGTLSREAACSLAAPQSRRR